MAKTKAAKKAKRGGRPRIAGAPRERSGRVDRKWATDRKEEDVMNTAVSARVRLFRLTEAEAKTQEGGTVIGRMLIGKEISIDQARAAERYAEVRNAFQRAIGAVPDAGRPPPPPMFETGAGDFESFCNRAKESHAAMQSCLRTLMTELRSPNPVSALDVFVTKDVHVPHLTGDLRIALNALHRHFTMERRHAKAA